ncbi:AGE family epimerase/isomerase [Desulfoprunum benzoelyticum]|uniref:Rhamnogalacturonyl hydrolase YesR n=1 Tax=Desulfoprunum benzoelyticum TaxID=1506996 RepID=A0A840V2W8_9BACT|nr:AGE family epimerase/isomerase [Desulfoprunum benzoelyticum]MBB5348079.1 rhamnogalacturonyl hydrolase YesR [Desulfoprunum benzoelyticum]MBM9531593.1 AGE family epimerase/isomerase [Desulfoprunum benzoelyticum]
MIEQGTIITALSKLIAWLETWRDVYGAYNGYVVHRTEAKRMERVHDTAWTQSAMIRGYGNLYRKSREQRWGESMTLAADLLASRYDPQTGKFRHTGHEDERFQSLVSCALGICALLSIAGLVDQKRREKYIRITTDHIRRYWLDVLWIESEGAFKFTEIDFFSPNVDRFVVNFNTMAAEALLAIYQTTGDTEFKDWALRVGEWLIERWNYTQIVNDKIIAGQITIADDPSSEWMAPGGFSYQFTSRQREPDNYVTLYTGLSLRGFWALYQVTQDDRFAEIIRAQSQYILAMRDPETRLFYHTAWRGQIEKNPQFVAGAGMTLLGLHEVKTLIGDRALPEDTIQSILSRAHANGSYPGFVGKNDTGHLRRNTGGIVWEDVAASMNWNAQWFEFLTGLIMDPAKIDAKVCNRTVRVVTKRFIYVDSPETVKITSWWPPRSWGLYLYYKCTTKARLAFYPVDLYGRIRSMLRGNKK